MLKGGDGVIHPLLTAERLTQLKKAEADRAQAFGTMLGLGLGMLSGVAAAKPSTLGSSVILQQDALAVMTVGNSNAAAIGSESDSLLAAYNATPFLSTNTPPLGAATGRILVEKMSDRDPAVMLVNVGGETHEIEFQTASR